ncbi:signal peptide peptidase SppA [Pendulispora albinea]|uniref:Signal peptide peptidase SppA n=1 Tax=Pendulispora albinea TaxID=2741071 RepID=A0ABZ2LYR9_9BACT
MTKKMRKAGLGAWLTALVAALVCPSVGQEAKAGEPMPTRGARLSSPGRSAASEDTAESLSLNPANLANMPSWELRWTGIGCHDAPQRVGCGHAFSAATPLLLGLSTGLRVDYLQTPWTVGFPYSGRDMTWVTWGLGYKLSDALSLGFSVQHSYSGNPYLNDLTGLSASFTVRPIDRLSFAAIAHDFNGPSTAPLGDRQQPVLDANYVLAAALRPTGRRELELGFELRYLAGSQLADSDQWIPRATLGVDVPYVGRLRGDVEVAHLPYDARRGVVGTAGLEIALGPATLGGGVLFGNGLGSTDSLGEFGTASIAGYRTPGIQIGQRAVSIRLESTPGPRTHIALLRKLWRIADDPSISGVALILRAEPATSYAHAEELADAVRVLRARKKKVLCSWEDNGAKSLYVCANADRTVVNPAGGLRYSGLKTQYLYIKGLLDNLGIRADMLRVSEHKSAPEMFTNEHSSDTAGRDHADLLRQYEAVFNRNVALGRKMTDARVRAETLKGPYVAAEAREANFVDGYAFDDELDRVMSEMLGGRTSLREYEEPKKVPETFGPRDKVGLLLVDGDMVDGRSETIPLLDSKLVGSYTIADSIAALKNDPTVKSVVLRIETGGGSSMSADVMWRELELLAKKKPLIVSMGSSAASGGYYIATPARTIYALPLTVTGSIGIFYGKADVSELLKKLGINVEVYKTTPRADAESFFRPFTEDERRVLAIKVQQFYDKFLERVAAGRHMTKAEVDLVGQGRVWTGQQALGHKLVDKMGGLREALAEARALGNLPYDAPLRTLPAPDASLFERALKLAGIGRSQMMTLEGLPVQVRDIARALAPMVVYKGDIPMARMEYVPVEGEGKDEEGD